MRTLMIVPVLLGLTFSLSAGATPNFPPALQQDLSIPNAPDCSICHTDGDQGGLGTVNTPFGKNMRARGLVAFDTSSLTTALDQMTTENVDSAGDCMDDIDELKAGRDPNLPDPAGTCPDGGAGGAGQPAETPSSASPSYGCGGKIAPSRSNGEVGWGLAFGLIGLIARRKRAIEPSKKD
jgi:hypothetical protein